MKIGVFGTGSVGSAIATALVANGHHVMMGSRSAGSERAVAWRDKTGTNAAEGSFADAASFGEIIFLCLNGAFVLDVLASIPAMDLHDKIIIDVTNPLDFSAGMPPRILPAFQTVSLGEQVQAAVPGAYVVKALNTLNYKLMVDARLVNEGDHNIFICGNDTVAKERVKDLLVENFHWRADNLLDLGDIRTAHCTEAIVPFWVLVMQSYHTPLFNFKVVH
ncbi:MAG: oxidoreductase [Flaviaesturariibacter sp.]|nr:oxidoreductase [Flaviaesturariibacter sp.]